MYWPVENWDPVHVAAVNLEAFVFLALFVVLSAVAWRRFGAPYGLFAAVALAIPLSLPAEDWPLLSLPRFGIVIFPLFLALGTLTANRRLHVTLLTVSCALLAVALVRWVRYEWVA